MPTDHMPEPLVVDLVEDTPASAAHGGDAEVVVLSDDGEARTGLPARAAQQEDGSVILTLRFPVVLRFRRNGSDEVREERVDALRFHRMTGADMRAISAASRDAAMPVMLARSARMAEGKLTPILDRMDAADVDDAVAVVGSFMGSSRFTAR
jgi:hypothetical protein